MVAALLIFWALLTKRLSRKSAAKGTKGIYFIKNGPYEFIRHPIYAGLLLSACTFTQEYLTLLRGLAFIILVGLILLRIRSDEGKTEVYFKSEYGEYKKNTKILIPYLY
jgi:protein-S-isoprenylcysteine O-methyltransferase Ste14